jgi:hypothetical protein
MEAMTTATNEAKSFLGARFMHAARALSVALCLALSFPGYAPSQTKPAAGSPPDVELHIEGPASLPSATRFLVALVNRSPKPIAAVLPNRERSYNVWARWQIRDAQGVLVAPKPDRQIFCSGTTMYLQTFDWLDGPDQMPVLGEKPQLKEEDVLVANPGQKLWLPVVAPDERFDLTAAGTYSITLRYEFQPSFYALPTESGKAELLRQSPALVLESNALTVARK